MRRAKTAEPTNLSFGLWTLVGRRKHTLNCFPDGRAHWRHLANTTELSVCGAMDWRLMYGRSM